MYSILVQMLNRIYFVAKTNQSAYYDCYNSIGSRLIQLKLITKTTVNCTVTIIFVYPHRFNIKLYVWFMVSTGSTRYLISDN